MLLNKNVIYITNLIKNVIEYGITDKELERAKIAIKSAILMQLESVNSRARILANSLIFKGKIIPMKKIINQIEKVNSDDLVKILKGIVKSKPSLAVYGNSKDVISYKDLKKLF